MSMKNKVTILFPFLFVAYYVANFFSINPICFTWLSLVKVSAILFALSLMVLFFCYLYFRDIEKSAIAALFLLYMIFFFKLFTIPFQLLNISLSSDLLGLMLTFILALFMIRALKNLEGFQLLPGFLTIFLIVLLIIPVFNLVKLNYIQSKSQLISNPISQQFNTDLPDIYHIVLDGYGRADVLSKRCNLDNTSFLNELKNRNFTVRDDCYSNYIITPLALTSTQTHSYLEPSTIQRTMSRAIISKIVQENGVASELSQYGYTYKEIASPVATCAESEVTYMYHNFSLVLSLILDQTVLSLLYSPRDYISDYCLWRSKISNQLLKLEQVSLQNDNPKYVYCHILLPHPPFVFGAYGEAINPDRPFTTNDGSDYINSGGSIEEYRFGYAQQLIYTNNRVTQVIDRIINQNQRPAIIIISSDHGPRILIDQENLKESHMEEAFPIFMAYHFPDEKHPNLDAMKTPVNLYRIILNFYCQTQYPLLPDRFFVSKWSRPLNFTEITDDFNELIVLPLEEN